ncbi:MAG: thiamine phosphate synthase [Acidobacteriota bacterium]|nr:thiamine phosphate synthase [Acidobacteriota bacterium]
MKRLFNPRLYLVTDRDLAGGRGLENVVAAAARGGVTAVQLREKRLETAAFIQAAVRLKSLLIPFGIPLLINDRVDIALAAGADGVHLGQSDASPEEARRRLGPDAVIGLSVETMAQARAAAGRDIDYLGVSPVFATPTKPEAGPGWGLEGLRALRVSIALPLVAIGGISAANAAAVLEAGADGLAVVSAIMAAADPEGAARGLRMLIDGTGTSAQA